MTKPVRLFVETAYHQAFRYGGWGWVREMGGAVSGAAGGDRGATPARIDLMALIGAMEGLPAGVPLSISSASSGVIAAARILAAPPTAGSDEAPSEDLDLWAIALKVSHGRSLTVKPALRTLNTPAAFCFAWAEVGQDKAKGKGRFTAAIPKVNLAKLQLG